MDFPEDHKKKNVINRKVKKKTKQKDTDPLEQKARKAYKARRSQLED